MKGYISEYYTDLTHIRVGDVLSWRTLWLEPFERPAYDYQEGSVIRIEPQKIVMSGGREIHTAKWQKYCPVLMSEIKDDE